MEQSKCLALIQEEAQISMMTMMMMMMIMMIVVGVVVEVSTRYTKVMT